MGVGSWLSRFVERGLVARFVLIELLVGLVGGFSPPILFLAFAYTARFRVALYGWSSSSGILVGLEIPLLMRILRGPLDVQGRRRARADLRLPRRAGGVAAFPLLLVPQLGLVRSALLFGLINAGVASGRTWLLPARSCGARRALRRAACVASLLLCAAGFAARPDHRRWPRTASTPTTWSWRDHAATSASC